MFWGPHRFACRVSGLCPAATEHGPAAARPGCHDGSDEHRVQPATDDGCRLPAAVNAAGSAVHDRAATGAKLHAWRPDADAGEQLTPTPGCCCLTSFTNTPVRHGCFCHPTSFIDIFLSSGLYLHLGSPQWSSMVLLYRLSFQFASFVDIFFSSFHPACPVICCHHNGHRWFFSIVFCHPPSFFAIQPLSDKLVGIENAIYQGRPVYRPTTMPPNTNHIYSSHRD